MTEQTITIFLDDSGVLDKSHPVPHFIYGGYVFLSVEEKDHAKRRYIKVVKRLKKLSGRNDELKAATISIESKRKLYSAMNPFRSVAAHVKTDRIYDTILSDRRSVHRYKDYVIKMLVKRTLEQLLSENIIKSDEDFRLDLNIDEQPTSTDGYYSLRDSIYEELKNGINNWDYGNARPPLFNNKVEVNVHYFVSDHNYLGQSADIIANRIWVSYCQDNINMRQRKNHFLLPFP